MEVKSRKGISGAVIKWIALISMLIDHTAAVLIEEGLWRTTYIARDWYRIDLTMRTLGRFAFPLYCFLLVEGFFHTRSRGRYLLRLFLFGLLAEIPFDLAFNHRLLEWSYQNVYFTLALGFVAIWVWEVLVRGEHPYSIRFWRSGGAVCALIAVMLTAYVCRTDYDAGGVALIFAFYAGRDVAWLRVLSVMLALGCLVLFGSHWIELIGGLGLLLISMYNGERGRQPKWLFYVFYPAHLAILVLLRSLIWGGI